MFTDLTADRALHSHRAMRLIRTCMLSVFLGTLLASQTTSPVNAGACDNQAVTMSERHQQLSAAVLINETPTNPYGERYAGSVCWSLEWIKAAGRPDKVVIHAEVDIPDRAMKIALEFSQNAERPAAASHFVTMTFEQTPDVGDGEVDSVPGMMLKSSERARGTPFEALTTKTGKGSFLIGLSNKETDRARNLQLLKDRSWFDIPLIYVSKRRAILAVEKGSRGEQVFREAMDHWERSQ
jgi:hypothetical protein